MFLWHIHKTEQLAYALGSGLILVLATILAYQALWKSREEEEGQARVKIDSLYAFSRWLRGTVPWVLIITLAASLIWSFAYAVYRSIRPPNW